MRRFTLGLGVYKIIAIGYFRRAYTSIKMDLVNQYNGCQV